MYQCSKERMKDKIDTFHCFGDAGRGGITRLSLSKEALEAREEFRRRCEALGMEICYDDMGNIYATLPGSEALPAILSGSHLDSVREGGIYDGTQGVLSALEVAETIVTEKIPHRHPYTVVVWTNEEGARFDPCMMSSGVLAGKFDRETMLASADTEGVTFGEALEASGWKGAKENRATSENGAALVELHIEQGPVLEAEEKQIGVVEGVVGMVIHEFTITGQSDHAGTTPMKYRKDALYATAKVLTYLHEKLDLLDEKLVYTTGRITSHPNVTTVIPDQVVFTLDARHQDMEVLRQVVEVIQSVPGEMEKCKVTSRELWSRSTVAFHEPFVTAVEEVTKELGYSSRRIYSGAGHDAQYIADIIPTTMIFLPSKDGHSHCQEESTTLEECVQGANVLLNTILRIDREI